MGNIIRNGTPVRWNWGQGWGEGKVIQIFNQPVTRTIKEQVITRNGSDDNPAYLIEQDDGDQVLKLRSEIEINRENA